MELCVSRISGNIVGFRVRWCGFRNVFRSTCFFFGDGCCPDIFVLWDHNNVTSRLSTILQQSLLRQALPGSGDRGVMATVLLLELPLVGTPNTE
jgi:hypothetical protein